MMSNNPLKSGLRVVGIKLNNRCPLRCRHCSVGFSNEYRGNNYRISADELRDIIAAIDPRIYTMVSFSGGEPSLEPSLLRVGIDACKAKGLSSVIVTAPIWAANPSAADQFLDSVRGLDHLVMSYDRYHLEFLKVAHYETAARAAASRGIFASFHITYSAEAELAELKDKIARVWHLGGESSMRTIPVGNAANAGNVKMELISIGSIGDLARIPRGCLLGNVLVDETRSVYGCCWSCGVQRSPFSVSKQPGGWAATMKQLEENVLFQTVRASGFIDALTPKGQEALVRLVKGRGFANECHLCLTAMQEGGAEIWDECIREKHPPGRQTLREPNSLMAGE